MVSSIHYLGVDASQVTRYESNGGASAWGGDGRSGAAKGHSAAMPRTYMLHETPLYALALPICRVGKISFACDAAEESAVVISCDGGCRNVILITRPRGAKVGLEVYGKVPVFDSQLPI